MATLTYTDEEIEELRKQAIDPVEEIQYRDRKVKYRSRAEIQEQLQVASGAGRGRRRYADNRRGLK
jgi:hypothetical protein